MPQVVIIKAYPDEPNSNRRGFEKYKTSERCVPAAGLEPEATMTFTDARKSILSPTTWAWMRGLEEVPSQPT